MDGPAAGVVEAKRHGITLTDTEAQSAKYNTDLPAWPWPLPFAYQSIGAETCFTNGLDPERRSRGVFAFHRP